MFFTSALLAAAPIFSCSRDLPCVSISVSDLDEILKRAHSLIVTANGSSERQSAETIILGADGDDVKIYDHTLVGVSLPQASYNLSYNYDTIGAPISSLVVLLNDSTRLLRVSGESKDQVESITTFLESSINKHSIHMGGHEFRFFLGYSLGCIFSAFLIGGIITIWQSKSCKRIGIPICSAIGLLLILVLPYERFLVGFALYQGDSSVLVRYGPQLSFISLLITILGIALSCFNPKWLVRVKTSR